MARHANSGQGLQPDGRLRTMVLSTLYELIFIEATKRNAYTGKVINTFRKLIYLMLCAHLRVRESIVEHNDNGFVPPELTDALANVDFFGILAKGKLNWI